LWRPLGNCLVCPPPFKPGPANVSIKLRRQEKREQAQTSTEKMQHCLIFSREIFYVTIVLR